MGNNVFSGSKEDKQIEIAIQRLKLSNRHAGHTKHVGFAWELQMSEFNGLEIYDILDGVSLASLQLLINEQSVSGKWLVVSSYGSLALKISHIYVRVEFITTEGITYVASHRWGDNTVLVNGKPFALDWIGVIPDGRIWVDCVTHLNDARALKRTLEKMGTIYVKCKVYATYCSGANSDVLECVFRGWMFQELSYAKPTDVVVDWTDAGVGAWALRLVGCLDQYDMHDLLVMTNSTNNPNSLAEAVGKVCRTLHDDRSRRAIDFRTWLTQLPLELEEIDQNEFTKQIKSVSTEPLRNLGDGARLTEYMTIKLVSLFKPFTSLTKIRPVESKRYMDTLLNNLNMALYSNEADALTASIASYEEFLKENDVLNVVGKCAEFIESEEYFIIEPKRVETSELLMDTLKVLVSSRRYSHTSGPNTMTTNGLISWLSTQDVINVYYTGNRISTWTKTGEGVELSTIREARSITTRVDVDAMLRRAEYFGDTNDPTA